MNAALLVAPAFSLLSLSAALCFHEGVTRTREFIVYWLPVLLFAGLIFSASSDSGSFQHSSRLVAPLLHWLFPHVSPQNVHAFVVTVRKCAHVTEYAIFALLLWRALRTRGRAAPGSVWTGPGSGDPGAGAELLRSNWDWRLAWLTLLIVIVYAASDEVHQRFVPSREASLRDVLIDSAGALLALLFLWGIGRWRQRW